MRVDMNRRSFFKRMSLAAGTAFFTLDFAKREKGRGPIFATMSVHPPIFPGPRGSATIRHHDTPESVLATLQRLQEDYKNWCAEEYATASEELRWALKCEVENMGYSVVDGSMEVVPGVPPMDHAWARATCQIQRDRSKSLSLGSPKEIRQFLRLDGGELTT